MRSLLLNISRLILTLTLALWLGGIAALTVFTLVLFAYYREAALAAGPLLFDVFDIYQRLLAILAVVAAVVLAWKRGGAGAWLVLGAVLMSALGVVVMAFYLMPEIHMLMDRQQTRTERFDMLHGLSIVVYFAEAMLLVVALSIITLQRPRSAQA